MLLELLLIDSELLHRYIVFFLFTKSEVVAYSDGQWHRHLCEISISFENNLMNRTVLSLLIFVLFRSYVENTNDWHSSYRIPYINVAQNLRELVLR